MKYLELVIEPDLDGRYKVSNSNYFAFVTPGIIKTTQTPCDEWETSYNIKFWFKEETCPEITVFGLAYTVIGVALYNQEWTDEAELSYLIRINGDEGGEYAICQNMRIDSAVVQELYDILRTEEAKKNEGMLKRHCFSEDCIFSNDYGIDDNGCRFRCVKCGTFFYDEEEMDLLVRSDFSGNGTFIERHIEGKQYPQPHIQKFRGCGKCFTNQFILDYFGSEGHQGG